MADFAVETRIAHPLKDVFAAYRDELPKLASFIPDVKSVEVLERREEPGVVHFVNRWRASTEVPSALKSFITEDKMSWLDRARWDEPKHQCSWNLDIVAFKDAAQCRGETRFFDEGSHTRVTINGTLTVDASKAGLPIPRMLAGGFNKAAETFVVALIKPGQAAMGPAVEKYLNHKKQQQR
jgi:hypothetical protein